MADAPSGDTPPPQFAGARSPDDAGDRSRTAERSRTSMRDDRRDQDAGPDCLTPRERAERWPLG